MPLSIGTFSPRRKSTFCIWLRNNSSAPLSIDPNHLSLRTEGGKTIPLSPLTQATPAPLAGQTLGPMEIASGYAVFEIPEAVITSDEPGSLVYEDPEGNRVARYLQIEAMKQFEGLSLREEVYYYSPVYPRVYWYPYYYPYAYYPFSIDFLYIYLPHRHYYYAVPSPPQQRQFLIPSTPKSRQFKGSGLPSPADDIEIEPKKKRQFPGR
ncbi:MAG: hypothetical protein HY760_01240 [Nitrospirae bacterium]|nr:hypothetical protein [Nitrospirota bacterium]